ncbi:MAG: glycosyltransferase family 39 protein [Anaerolineae bacterium]
MRDLLGRLASAAYLYAQEPAPSGRLPLAFQVWATLLALALLAAVWGRRRGFGRLALRTGGFAGSGALILVLARPWLAGGWSARIWPLALTAIAFGLPALTWLAGRRWPALATLGHTVALDADPAVGSRPPALLAAAGLVHMVGLFVLAGDPRVGVWPAVLGVACLLAAAWSTRSWAPRLDLLTPFGLPYLGLLLQGVLGGLLGVDLQAYRTFPYPDPWSPLLDVRALALAAAAWSVLATGALLARAAPARRYLALALLGVGLFALGVIWYVGTVGTLRSHGVTASDPYCYLQMASDLVEHGTPLHRFPLAELAQAEGLPVWPTAHVGYHPPGAGSWASTVWPVGWPVLLAPFYALGGEPAALWAAPLWALLAALLTWLLARILTPTSEPAAAWLVAGLAALLVITSPEGLHRSLVPMADAAAQALAVLVLLALALAARRDRLGWSALAGLALALAYDVRHPVLFLGLAALPALLEQPRPWRRRAVHLAVFGAVALLGALPDLAYHAMISGSPWTTESPEWFLLSLRHVGPSLNALLRDDLLRRDEFGYLLPLIVLGIVAQVRRPEERTGASMLLLSFGGILLFHLCYSALRWRDLISLFPWLAYWAARGAWALWRWAVRPSAGRTLRRTAVLACLVVALGVRAGYTVDMPWWKGVWTFGYVSATERTAFTQLAEALPTDAVVAVGLNSGAVERYSGRETVRPATWTAQEFDRFAAAVQAQGRAIYVLDDGEEIRDWLARVDLELRSVSVLDIPALGYGGQPLDRSVVLYAPAVP